MSTQLTLTLNVILGKDAEYEAICCLNSETKQCIQSWKIRQQKKDKINALNNRKTTIVIAVENMANILNKAIKKLGDRDNRTKEVAELNSIRRQIIWLKSYNTKSVQIAEESYRNN